MRSLGRNIAGPVLERGIGTVQASEGTRDRLRLLIDGVSKKFDHVLFAEGCELITAEMRTVLLWRDDHEDEHLLQRDASLDNHKGDKVGRRFQSPDSHLHSVGYLVFLECRMDVWESLRVCSVLLQPIIPTCELSRFPVTHRLETCSVDTVPCRRLGAPFIVGIGLTSSRRKAHAVQFGACFPETLQGGTSQVPSFVILQIIPLWACFLANTVISSLLKCHPPKWNCVDESTIAGI